MAWLSFSREARARLAGVLRALLIAQLVVSLCLVIFCYNTSVKVLGLLKNIHMVTVYILYALVLMQTYCMKLQYTAGLRLMSWFLRCPHWNRVMLVSRVWMACGTAVALNGILVYYASRITLRALMRELSNSLRIGISQYLSEPTWKRMLDTMQIELGCCGADTPSDWHFIPWININFLNENSDLVMKLAGADGNVLPPVSPYSCCTPRVLAACYHDPLQQSEWHDVWSDGSPLLSASLHTRGCVEAVRAPLTKALLALQLLSMLVFLLQTIIITLAQLLRTSAHDAILSGDCEGVGKAHLFWRTKRSKPPQPLREDPTPEELSLLLEPSTSQAFTVAMDSPFRRKKARRRILRRSKGRRSQSYLYLS
ncbi:tetraspanin family domain-containing protein [Phthorimaea operculella]|nr:tetraspanin family domain-containing protein [Phthorimaea operculella]